MRYQPNVWCGNQSIENITNQPHPSPHPLLLPLRQRLLEQIPCEIDIGGVFIWAICRRSGLFLNRHDEFLTYSICYQWVVYLAGKTK